MKNSASSYAVTGVMSFEEDLASLSEMFPACDVSTLRNYLEMFSGDPNYMSSIVNILLEAGNSSGVKQGQNSIPGHGLKRSANFGEDSLQNECVSGAVTSPRKALKNDFSRKEANFSSTSVALIEIKEEESKLGMFGKNTSEFCTSKSSPVTDRKDRSPRKVFKHDFDDHNKATSSSEEDEIVFVKSVASPPKSCFHRTGYSDTVISSPRKGTGICIRYKSGALHPSMNKPKKLQIVELYDDDNRKSGVISQPKKAHSLSSQPPSRKGSSTSKCSMSVTETSVEMDDTLPKFCTSVSKEKATENIANVTHVNSVDHPQSKERNEVGEESSSENNHSPVVEALTDLEILRKVFPEADSKHISSLLDKYADQPNRVAFVGKELGSTGNQCSQSGKKKQVLSVPNWFWQTGEGKLVPFTDSECNALEKEFSSYSPSHSVTAFVKVRLPGSAKSYDVNFAGMIMTCEKGQKTIIVRVPSGSDDNKQIGGKSLVPQEALTVPTDWQQQTGSVELINVRPGSAEWDHVQRSLKGSLRAAQVTDIQRVQNKWLYRKYAIQRHLMKDKNGPTCINEKELFHGTRHTKPDVIWKGEDGFDMRHSADGMWGRGTYFATEASYCHQGFVHFNPQRRQYQLFLAHVLTGDSVFLPPNRNIKMPPPKRGSDIRYDSVNGVTNGCTVYILYKLDMAYPAYLITYTINNNIDHGLR